MNDTTSPECRLLAGWYAYFIQGLLAIVCIGTLVFKRSTETPRRDLVTFFYDVVKQSAGSGFGHFSNIFLATYLSSRHVSQPGASHECSWYFASYITDCTLGLCINLSLLWILENHIMRLYWPQKTNGLQFGFYGNPPSFHLFWPQLITWICIIAVSKLCIVAFLILVSGPIDDIVGVIFDELFVGAPKLQLLTVMILIPCCMNVVQFWITDTFIMNDNHTVRSPLLPRRGTDSMLAQPFLAVKTTDDDTVETKMWYPGPQTAVMAVVSADANNHAGVQLSGLKK